VLEGSILDYLFSSFWSFIFLLIYFDSTKLSVSVDTCTVTNSKESSSVDDFLHIGWGRLADQILFV